MRISLIAAMAADNRVIGKNGQLPWHLPEDLANFKALTLGHPVIMGSVTYQSLPPKFRPLPGRRNIVLSEKPVEGIETFASIESLVRTLEGERIDQIFVIGGSRTYQGFIDAGLADEIWLSLVPGHYDGDAFFPSFEKGFEVAERRPFETFELIRYVRA
jgi:dihydrofolate reductase